jgi:integrase
MKSTTPEPRFKLLSFTNASGSESWRVAGIKRDGSRVRQNFANPDDAQLRLTALEAEYWAGHQEVTLRATRLTDAQIRLCETALAILEEDTALIPAASHWKHHGKNQATNGDAPKLDKAVTEFKAWLKETPTLRDKTKINLRTRVSMFSNSMPNLPVPNFTPDHVDEYLAKRNASPASKDNDKRALSRFFGWCMERPRRWTLVNPCVAVSVEKGERPPPSILTVAACEKLMAEAQQFKKGKMAPYFAVCLFGGLRPYEAQRLTWAQVNLTDKEIRLEANQTKTGRPRTVHLDEPLLRWLKRCKKKPFVPPNFRNDFRRMLKRLGYGTPTKEHPKVSPWPEDVMRHTAISHHFRKHQSYGMAAERFGNSEAIIKQHYQGRVSSTETEQFYSIAPGQRGGGKRKQAPGGGRASTKRVRKVAESKAGRK